MKTIRETSANEVDARWREAVDTYRRAELRQPHDSSVSGLVGVNDYSPSEPPSGQWREVLETAVGMAALLTLAAIFYFIWAVGATLTTN